MNELISFDKLDSEIARDIVNNNKYRYLISVRLPCSVAEFKKYYSKYIVEIRACRGCKPKVYDVIFNLTS